MRILLVLFCFYISFPIQTVYANAAENLTIGEAIQATLTYYNELKALQENRQSALHEVRYAKAGYGPRVDVTAKVGAEYTNTNITRSYDQSNTYEAHEIGLTLVQPIWNGMATANKVDTASYRVESLDNRVLDLASRLSLDTLIAYVDLLRRQQIVDFAENNVMQHQTILKAQKTRQQSGAGTLADVTQVEGRLARAQSTLIDAKANLETVRERLMRLTNLTLPYTLNPVDLPDMVFVPSELLFMAETDNHQLLSYMADTKMAQSDANLAKSAYQPVINLEVGPRYYDNSQKGSNWETAVDAKVVLRWNIFNSGADKANFDSASAVTRQRRAEMLNYRNTLEQQINNTYTQLVSAREQVATYITAVQYNKETRDSFQKQFIIGERSLLDVLDSESELFNSSVQLATVKGNTIIYSYSLLALAGNLLDYFNLSAETILN